jgi:16S rRNA (guanine527-N7)-methyltransferase
VDNTLDAEALLEGAKALGVALTPAAIGPLLTLRTELLRWNAKVNLTAITAPDEVLEKHLLDSLAVVPEVEKAVSVLDVGAGAGFPGLVLKAQCPHLQVTFVEPVGKKVSFMKHAALTLKMSQVKALQARAEGFPESEGIPKSDVVVSRALMELPAWVALAKRYVVPGGVVLAMLGQAPAEAEVERLGVEHGAKRSTLRRYVLPFSKASRAIASFEF